MKALRAPETFAVDGNVVYAADEVLSAFRLSDGTELWQVADPSGEGLGGSGGVVIGLEGPDRVRVWAPWTYDLVVSRRTGAVLALRSSSGAAVPTEMTPLPHRPATQYRVEMGLKEVIARRPSGEVAWSINIDKPWYDPVPAEEVAGGLVLLTSSGHLVVLDYAS